MASDEIPADYAVRVNYLKEKADKGVLLSNDRILSEVRTAARRGVKSLATFLGKIEHKIKEV